MYDVLPPPAQVLRYAFVVLLPFVGQTLQFVFFEEALQFLLLLPLHYHPLLLLLLLRFLPHPHSRYSLLHLDLQTL